MPGWRRVRRVCRRSPGGAGASRRGSGALRARSRGCARRARACWREPRSRAGAVSGRQAGCGIARSRASAAAHCPAQGQRFGRCRVQRRAEIRGRSAGCPAPPAQIRTCALTHPAPALSVDGKSLRRPRVEDGHGGPVLPAQGVQTFPWVACPLRPSADSPHPEPPQGPHELRQRRAACGHRVIAKPSAEHPSKPPCCHHRVVMHAPTQLGLDGLGGSVASASGPVSGPDRSAHCASSGSSA